MRHYEILLYVHPDHRDQLASMTERYTQLIQSKGGAIHYLESERLPVKLAYPIAKVYEPYYIRLNIECDKAILIELEESFSFNDAIIRYLTLKQNRAITEVSPFKKNNKDSTGEAESTANATPTVSEESSAENEQSDTTHAIEATE